MFVFTKKYCISQIEIWQNAFVQRNNKKKPLPPSMRFSFLTSSYPNVWSSDKSLFQLILKFVKLMSGCIAWLQSIFPSLPTPRLMQEPRPDFSLCSLWYGCCHTYRTVCMRTAACFLFCFFLASWDMIKHIAAVQQLCMYAWACLCVCVL